MREFPEHPAERVRAIERHLNFVNDLRAAVEGTRTKKQTLAVIDARIASLRAAQSAARSAARALETDEE